MAARRPPQAAASSSTTGQISAGPDTSSTRRKSADTLDMSQKLMPVLMSAFTRRSSDTPRARFTPAPGTDAAYAPKSPSVMA